jgi:hypothetical protein
MSWRRLAAILRAHAARRYRAVVTRNVMGCSTVIAWSSRAITVTVGRNRFIAPLSLLMAQCASLIAPYGRRSRRTSDPRAPRQQCPDGRLNFHAFAPELALNIAQYA